MQQSERKLKMGLDFIVLAYIAFFVGFVIGYIVMTKTLAPHGITDDGADGLLIVVPAFFVGIICGVVVLYVGEYTAWDYRWGIVAVVLCAPGVPIAAKIVRVVVGGFVALVKRLIAMV